MEKDKIYIETLELCAKLMLNCANKLREYGETIDKCERDYLFLFKEFDEVYTKNEKLNEKIANILDGKVKIKGETNENGNSCLRAKRTR